MLLNLLEMYEAAIRELRASRDQRLGDFLLRLERHRSEVVAALTAEQAAAVSSAREIATEFMLWDG
jgi:hypothetical protein